MPGFIPFFWGGGGGVKNPVGCVSCTYPRLTGCHLVVELACYFLVQCVFVEAHRSLRAGEMFFPSSSVLRSLHAHLAQPPLLCRSVDCPHHEPSVLVEKSHFPELGLRSSLRRFCLQFSQQRVALMATVDCLQSRCLHCLVIARTQLCPLWQL